MTKEQHLLIIAMEECAEVTQRVSKALRFGLDQIQPNQSLDNRERVIYEYSDLVAIMDLLGLFPSYEMVKKKKLKVEKFLQYSEKICKTLDKNEQR